MNRVILSGILIYALLLLGLATRTGGLLALALLLVVYLSAGLFYGPASPNLRVFRSITPDRLSPGDPIYFNLTVTNLGLRLENVLLEDPLPPGFELIEGQNSLLTSLPAGQTVQIDYIASAPRGYFTFSGLAASAEDLLGVFSRKVEGLAPGQILVLPEVPRLKSVPIRPRHTRVYSGIIPARQGGSGVDFFGVREYQPGDPVNRVNWKTSARYVDILFSNDFEQERVADVGLILDARSRTIVHTSQGSLFEHVVTATAALADALLREGNRVGLLIYGGYLDWTYPGYGKIQRERILQALAHARMGESTIFSKLEHLPTRVFPSRSQLVLISPLVNDDYTIIISMRARGYQVMVVSPDPVAYEKASTWRPRSTELAFRLARLERKLLLSRLRHAGVQVIDWDVSEPIDQVLNVSARQLALSQSA